MYTAMHIWKGRRHCKNTYVTLSMDLCGGQEPRVSGEDHRWVSVVRVPPYMTWGFSFTVSPSLPHSMSCFTLSLLLCIRALRFMADKTVVGSQPSHTPCPSSVVRGTDKSITQVHGEMLAHICGCSCPCQHSLPPIAAVTSQLPH